MNFLNMIGYHIYENTLDLYKFKKISIYYHEPEGSFLLLGTKTEFTKHSKSGFWHHMIMLPLVGNEKDQELIKLFYKERGEPSSSNGSGRVWHEKYKPTFELVREIDLPCLKEELKYDSAQVIKGLEGKIKEIKETIKQCVK